MAQKPMFDPNKHYVSNTENLTSPTFVHAMDHGVEVALRVANVWSQGAGAIFEIVGIFLSGVLDALGNNLLGVPSLGKILRGIFHWLGTIFSAGFDLVAMLVWSLLNLLADGTAVLVRVLVGLLGWSGWLARKGATDFLSGLAGAIIAILGKTVALIQALIFMQMGERPLNEHEKTILKQVYRNSVAMQNVRIIQGFAGLFSVTDRPFALGHRIYLRQVDSTKDPALFAHECCHVWQFQRVGVRYLIEALWAQWRVENAYSWEAEIARGHVHWQDFNWEAQAQFVQDVYNGGRRKPPTHTTGEFYDDDPVGENVEYQRRGVDHTELARTTVTWIRNKGE